MYFNRGDKMFHVVILTVFDSGTIYCSNDVCGLIGGQDISGSDFACL